MKWLVIEMHEKSFKRTGFIDNSQESAKAVPADVLISNFQNSEEVLHWIGDGILKLEKLMGPYLNFHKIAV